MRLGDRALLVLMVELKGDTGPWAGGALGRCFDFRCFDAVQPILCEDTGPTASTADDAGSSVSSA